MRIRPLFVLDIIRVSFLPPPSLPSLLFLGGEPITQKLEYSRVCYPYKSILSWVSSGLFRRIGDYRSVSHGSQTDNQNGKTVGRWVIFFNNDKLYYFQYLDVSSYWDHSPLAVGGKVGRKGKEFPSRPFVLSVLWARIKFAPLTVQSHDNRRKYPPHAPA